MNEQEVSDAIQALRKRIGEKAEIYMRIGEPKWGGGIVSMTVYPFGFTGKITQTFFADTCRHALTQAGAWAATAVAEIETGTIRRMAMSIISLTDQHGRCTQAHLTADGFSADEIARLGGRACDKASKMAGGNFYRIEAAEPAKAA